MKASTICLMVLLCVAGFAEPARANAQSQSSSLIEDVLPEHPAVPKKKPVTKSDILYGISNGYLASAAWLDVSTTARGLDHPTMAYRNDGTFLMRYSITERGWARFLGNRNAFAVDSANAVKDVGVAMLGRELYRRGGRWRYFAFGLVLAQATDSLVASIGNRHALSSVDVNVRRQTGYRGIIIWSH